LKEIGGRFECQSQPGVRTVVRLEVALGSGGTSISMASCMCIRGVKPPPNTCGNPRFAVPKATKRATARVRVSLAGLDSPGRFRDTHIHGYCSSLNKTYAAADHQTMSAHKPVDSLKNPSKNWRPESPDAASAWSFGRVPACLDPWYFVHAQPTPYRP